MRSFENKLQPGEKNQSPGRVTCPELSLAEDEPMRSVCERGA
jgi:hypothetical protein